MGNTYNKIKVLEHNIGVLQEIARKVLASRIEASELDRKRKEIKLDIDKHS